MEDLQKVLSDLTYVGQLGLNLIMPVLLCMGGAWLLNTRVGVGAWIYVPALFLGLGAGAVSFRNFYRKVVMKGHRKTTQRQKRGETWTKHL